ncbi:MAG TPA: Hsp70 family protein [Candidatus Acidoferrales bacterium]|nr:Hsp70 family protein [Candidatus Acidoferrales bacterium]
MRKAIGLDFGTTNSALAIAKPDAAVQLAEFGSRSTFRSVLYFEENENAQIRQPRVVAGPDAIQSYLSAKTPGRLIQSMKSYLASRLFTQTQILGETYSLEDLIGILLRYLRKSAERQLGDLGSTLVVGRPVHFSGARDEADDEFAVNRLRVAFGNAGFTDVHFLPEPIAAAYKYQQRLDHQELVLIADFGGGTSDFSLVQLQGKSSSEGKGQSSVIGTDGVGIAGDTFDSKLVRNLIAPMLGLGSRYKSQFGKILTVPNWLYEHLERWHYLTFLKTRKNMELLRRIHFEALEPQKIEAFIDLVDHDLGYRLYQSIEQTKCALSEEIQSSFHFQEATVSIERNVARSEFGAWIEPEVVQIDRCIERLFAACHVAPEDVDAIFMTGGSSFVPVIRRLFEDKFGAKTPIRAGQEFTSVAEGLAIDALERGI